MRVAATILSLFIAITALQAQELPVLPKPVVAQPDAQVVSFHLSPVIDYRGVDAGMQQRLNWHVNRIASKNAGRKLRIVLLQKGMPSHNESDFEKRWKDSLGTEGYLLVADQDHFELTANTETGIFYGLQTISQLNQGGWNHAVKIADWPSFVHRQVYDDISRGPISTVSYVKSQIERLASLKINYLSFYIEHVVQPKSHPDFAPANGKFTIEQIKELSAYAAKFHMQLVASFQSFGHFEKILSLPQYQSMGETSTMISPIDEKAKQFLRDVIGELCDAFNAPFFNVNCDETFDLGKGKSKKYTDSVGVTRFYADHIRFLYDVVRSHNKQLMMWGDIALEHEEMLDALPRDIVYLTWEYGTQASFDKWIHPFAKRGLRFMACPGVLNSYRMFPDMVMAYKNIETFSAEAKRAGAEGIVTTVWDEGDAYLFSGDWYGVYKAAENSWNVWSNNKQSFDERFASIAYGKTGRHYVNALDSLMQLRNFPLTFNLNNNVWRAALVPAKGRKLILNNANEKEIARVAMHAKQALQQVKPERNPADVNTMMIAIDEYLLMMQARAAMPVIASKYAQAIRSGDAQTLQSVKHSLIDLRRQYTALADAFSTAWLRENQPYALDVALRPMTDARHSLDSILADISVQATRLQEKKTLADAASVRLDIESTSHTYFQYWLMCGPFASETNGKTPSFLYGGDGVEKLPKPGDLISYKNKTYRWQKYASQSGGITNVDDFYTGSAAGTAYVFCTVTTDKPLQAKAFAALPAGSEVFCNGKNLFINGKQPVAEEASFTLPLNAGTNAVLFKIPGARMHWSFSFRLDPSITVTNQKHKYYLNPEKQTHEPE